MDSYLARPGSIPLDSQNQSFHKYTIHVVDGKNAKPATTHASRALKTIVKSDASPSAGNVSSVKFPPDSIPHNNNHLRITSSPVKDSRSTSKSRSVQNVFFVVDLHNPKNKKTTSVGDSETTSNSEKVGRKDKRKFHYFSEPKLYDLDSKKPLQEKLNITCPPSQVQGDVERQFAIYFDHEKIDLNDLSGVIGRSSVSTEAQNTQQAFQDSIDHHIGQLIAKELSKFQSGFTPIIRGNRVFVKPGSKAFGLCEIAGLQGKVVYGENGRGNILLEPSTAHFYRNILVSDFLQEFFHTCAIACMVDSKMLSRISSVLKGVQVIAASRKDEPSKVSSITSVEFGVGQPSDYLQALGMSTSALKFPDMPLINIGSTEKPDYRPAELCKIVSGPGKEQIFGGKLPVSLSDEHFKLDPPAKREDKPHGSLGDPFPKSKADGFSLCFVNLTTEVNGKPIKAVNDDVMASIKEEIGNRYGGSLGEAVKESKDLEATACNLGSALAFPPKFVPSIKSVLVMVIPHGFSVKEIDKIKNECHLRYGMQCCIVNGRDATRSYHPVEKLDMVLFTGGLVRKMFTKAKIPAQTGTFGGLESTVEGSTLGIHISELASGRSYLIDIVSISDNRVVVTSSRVVNINHSDIQLGLAAEILYSIEKYHSQARGAHTTFFLSGLTGKASQIPAFLHRELQHWIPHISDEGLGLDMETRVLSLTSITSAPRVLMAEKNKRIMLDSTASKGHDPVGDLEINNLRLHSENIASKVYNHPSHVNKTIVNTSYSPSLETFFVSEFKGEPTVEYGTLADLVQTKFHGTALSTHSRPTVLYLAQEASKHSRLHVYSIPADPATLPKPDLEAVKVDTKCYKKNPEPEKQVLDWHITPVHEKLKDTFYFL